MNQLDPADAADVALFADSLSITSEELLAIVARVGPMRPAIRFFAMRSATEAKRGKPHVVPSRSSPATVDVQPHALFSLPVVESLHSPSQPIERAGGRPAA